MIQGMAKEIWLSSDRVDSYKQIKIALHRQGINVGVRRLWQLLKKANCQSVMTKKYRKPVRKVLAHQLNSVRDGRFVSDILLEALSQHPKSAYLHSEMGSEYTSSVFEN
ncbi:Transposase InsO and inactivated derivatives (Tra5) [Fructobacillus evanidus]|uniref:hypothetical protein n=1 Tax=Fructobacillus evanidus TaxID=3064281 RepID=UPI002D8C279C|nr:Transposase InsO and inactivated derivatives (Tra5) [Fructobacillus sp. LMG 32999]